MARPRKSAPPEGLEPEAAPSAPPEGLVRVCKGGECLDVHPTCLESHLKAGWKAE
jgi:hypothetical protein